MVRGRPDRDSMRRRSGALSASRRRIDWSGSPCSANNAATWWGRPEDAATVAAERARLVWIVSIDSLGSKTKAPGIEGSDRSSVT
jgi:hypothetical protein